MCARFANPADCPDCGKRKRTARLETADNTTIPDDLSRDKMRGDRVYRGYRPEVLLVNPVLGE